MKTNDARFGSAYLLSYLPLNYPTHFYTRDDVIVLKVILIVIIESPWHLFAYFLVTDTYTCVISKFHKQIMEFTISADI